MFFGLYGVLILSVLLMAELFNLSFDYVIVILIIFVQFVLSPYIMDLIWGTCIKLILIIRPQITLKSLLKKFALTNTEKYLNKEEIIGWYCRCVVPYIGIKEIITEGKRYRVYTFYAKWVPVFLLIAVGLLGMLLI